jgi:ParB-like nuclease domain
VTSTTTTGYRRALNAEPRPNAVLEVHPVADLFPMLPDDELKDLAADITERGLLQPIVLDTEGRILDGRNRYAACQLAGIEPTFTTYDGDDPEGYALAVNIARREMTKGQKAITYLTSTALEPEALAAEYATVVGEFPRRDLEYAARTMAAIAKTVMP